ncbi:MAG TPA: hypothetical protein VHT26_01210 [Trebonia sp.]|nr:hypothetical protein [Trebonia sp.]
MIVAAAICPSPPLLVTELTGQADILPELRAACAAAVARLLAAAPDVVAVAGPAETTGPWDPAGQLSLASFAPALRQGRPLSDNSKKRHAGPAAAPAPLPLALGIGALLLDEAGYTGPRTLHGIAESEPAATCLALGRRLTASAPRVALLAVGDGTARRSASAPGYLDERAAPFDEAVARAVRDGDLPAIAALDPALAAALLAAGRPAWQALAGALSATDPQSADYPAADYPAADRPTPDHRPADRLAARRPQTAVLYSDAPLGVAYLVATLIPQPAPLP